MEYQQVRMIAETRGITCEGPLWDAENKILYYVDIGSAMLYRMAWASGQTEAIKLPQMAGFIALSRDGGLILGMEDGIYAARDGGYMRLDDAKKIAGIRFNDGKAGPDGRLYAGTILRGGGAHLYRMDAGGHLSVLLDNVAVSNGLDWSPDCRTFYYADTPTRRVDAFDFCPQTGAISARRTVIDLVGMTGSPDGLTVDCDGNLWVAVWGGEKVLHVNPAHGEILGEIAVGAPRVSCCAFAGPQLDELVITTASGGEDDTARSGCVFSARTGAKGRLPFRVALCTLQE